MPVEKTCEEGRPFITQSLHDSSRDLRPVNRTKKVEQLLAKNRRTNFLFTSNVKPSRCYRNSLWKVGKQEADEEVLKRICMPEENLQVGRVELEGVDSYV